MNRFNRLTVFVAACAVFSAVVGLSGLTGWTLHLASQLIRRAAPLTMKVNADACVVLIGASFWLLDLPSFSLAGKRAAKAWAAVAGLVGLLGVAKHLSRGGLASERFSLPRAADPDTDRHITGRKQAESAFAAQAKELARFDQALQSQTLLLQCVLDSIGEGLVAADEHGQLFLWNPAAEKIIGMGMASIPGEQWTEHYGFYMPGTLTPFPVDQIPLARAIQGQADTKAEIFVRNPGRPEGTLIETNAQPLRDKDGALRGGVIAIRDITQRRKDEESIGKLHEELEQRVADRTAELKEANKELETFTYSVAHDLRAPLRHIAGFSGILLEEFGPSMDARAHHYLERIKDGAGKMGQLVDELLSLAQVSRQETRMQGVNLNAIVEEVIGVLEPDIRGRQVEWKIAELPFVECDPTLIKLVFQNLISNALKYSRPRPLAVIEIGQTEEGAFFVRDNGVGFNMKYADKLFGVFQRLHRADEFEGIGVGLAIVHRIIKKHQASVWAESELNQGATFYFTLGRPQPAEENANVVLERDQ